MNSGGYLTQPGQIFSLNGECRPFDHLANGTVPADAVVAVVLRRLAPMQAESDSIYAFVNGSAIGSDGAAQKAGYQVPSPRGQADVIKQAWKTANVDANKLAYVE